MIRITPILQYFRRSNLAISLLFITFASNMRTCAQECAHP